MTFKSHLSPLITVIIATYNAERHLERALNSYAIQTLENKELIIIDGGSADGTLAIIEKYHPFVARSISEKDRGIYDAWNKGIKLARGRWLYFMGADDFFANTEALASIAPSLEAAEGKSLIAYTTIKLTAESGATIDIQGRPWEIARKHYRQEMTIPHQGVFQHQLLFKNFGEFDPTFRICGDYEMLLRYLKNHDAIFIPGEPLTSMQFGGISSSLEHTQLRIAELRHARTKNGVNEFSPLLFFRSVRAALRRTIEKVLGKKVSDSVSDLYRLALGKPRLWTKKY